MVSELTALVSEPETQWKGQRVVPNHSKYWSQAMQMVLDRDAAGKLERPLDGHNYLRAIAYEIAEKAWHAGNVKKEEQARYRPEPMARIRNDEMDAEKRRQAQLAGLAKFRARQGEL